MIRRVINLSLALVLGAACVNVNPVPTGTVGPTNTPSPTATSTAAAATATPQASPTPCCTSRPTLPAQTPAGTMDPELAAQINEVVAGVPAVRELEPTTEVPFELITRDQFRDDLLALLDEDVSPEIRAAEERVLKRLGLLPANANMDELITELYGTQVAAYYQPENGRFYIIERDQPFGPSDKIIVAHEYTHALQDQHFDLEGTTITDPSESDAILGQLAVIEGDATLSSQLWAEANLTPDEMFELLMQALGGLDELNMEGIPLVLRRQLEFPYGEGLVFVSGLHDAGGFAAVDAALQTPPASTEQILHPEKYNADPALSEAPIDVQAPDLLDSLGDGWFQVYEQTMGELGIQILATGGEEPDILIPGLPVDWPHQEAAAGWGGDRLRMYEAMSGAWYIAWTTVWDTQADASQFEGRIAELEGTFAGPMRVEANGLEVQVRIASREDLLFDCCR